MEDEAAKIDSVEVEGNEKEEENADEWGPPEYYHSNVNVDEVLKELVERKSKLQSFTQFNLDYAVEDLNHEYTRAVDSNARLRNSQRELRNENVTSGLDTHARRIESQMKGMVAQSSAESEASLTKFDELMKRLKQTAAAQRLNIASSGKDIASQSEVDKETPHAGV